MPYTPEQKRVIKAIRREAVRRYGKGGWTKAERRKLRSAFQTGRIESNLQQLAGGHADSRGWRQERASLYPDASLPNSVRRYFNEADQHYRGQAPWLLAADVQRPAAQYRGRYRNARGEAIKLTRKTIRGGAVGGPSGGAQGPSKGGRNVRTTKVITPGVDRSRDRKMLLMQYLTERDKPGALLDTAMGLKDLQDTPREVKTTRKVTKGDKAGKREQPAAKGGKVHGGGGWQGSKNIVMHALGGQPATYKRAANHPLSISNPGSDHNTANKNAFAGDTTYGTGRVLAKRLGIKNWKPGTYTRHIIAAAGGKKYSVQILENVEGHYDHTHIGVQRA